MRQVTPAIGKTGAVEGRLQRPLAALHAAHGVFQEDDGVVDEKPDGQRQGKRNRDQHPRPQTPRSDRRGFRPPGRKPVGLIFCPISF